MNKKESTEKVEETKEIATIPTASMEVDNVAPDFMSADRGMGTKDIEASELGLPRIALLQSTSPQVESGEGRPGEFYHLLAGRNLGAKLRVIPILVTKAFILWRPRKNDTGGILARSNDAVNWTPPTGSFEVTLDNKKKVTWELKPTVKESKLDQWGSSDPSDASSQPAATLMMNVLVYLPDFPELSPSVLTLQRSSLKPGKSWLGKVKMASAPSFGLVFDVTSETVTGKQGTYKAPIFAGAGFVKDKGLYDNLRELCVRFEKTGVKVQEDGLDTDAVEDDNAATGGAEKQGFKAGSDDF